MDLRLTQLFTMMFVGSSVLGQFPIIGTSSRDLLPVTTLRNAGLKLMKRPLVTDTVLVLVNLDLSPYTNIDIPTLPPGYFNYGVGYFSEDLFDLDPTTIEYMLFAGYSGYNHIWVFREDGTMLFEHQPAWLPFPGYSLAQRGDPIFNTPDGALLVINSNNSSNSTVYQLPGLLPCMDCDGSISSGLDDEGITYDLTGGPMFHAFPNPAVEEATIQITWPPGVENGEMIFHDLGGAEVERIVVNKSLDQIVVNSSMLAPGVYSYSLHTEAGLVRGQRLVVVK